MLLLAQMRVSLIQSAIRSRSPSIKADVFDARNLAREAKTRRVSPFNFLDFSRMIVPEYYATVFIFWVPLLSLLAFPAHQPRIFFILSPPYSYPTV